MNNGILRNLIFTYVGGVGGASFPKNHRVFETALPHGVGGKFSLAEHLDHHRRGDLPEFHGISHDE